MTNARLACLREEIELVASYVRTRERCGLFSLTTFMVAEKARKNGISDAELDAAWKAHEVLR